MLPNLRSFIKRQTSDTSNDNVWYNEWQQVTVNGNEWYNDWYNEWQRMTTSDNEWQWVVISVNFLFFFERHPKENPLNLEEDFEEDLLN